MIFDPELIRRVESSAARVSMATAASFVDRHPDDPARAIVLAGGAAVALGAGRYVNRAVGVTLDDLDDDQLDELEAFFAEAGLPPSLEVASWAPPGLLARLAERSYTVDWFRNVYVAALDARPVVEHPALSIEEVTDDNLDSWLETLRTGFDTATASDATTSDDFALASRRVEGSRQFLAHLDGVPVGCGTMICESGVAWLGGAATAPSFRRRGVQGALVRRRMAEAVEAGCGLAVLTATPTGDSARNVARLGFTLAYCQAVMTRRSDGVRTQADD